MRKIGSFFRDLFYLMKPYFVSEERVFAWTMLVVLVGLSFAQVGAGVVLSFTRNILYTALQEKHSAAFFRALFWFTPRPQGLPQPGFFIMALPLIFSGVLSLYLQSWLQIRWRRWMTANMVDNWLDGSAHFRLMLTRDQQDLATDNPDQRIDEDINLVTDNSLTFTLGIIQNVVTFVSYASLLWVLSAPFHPFGLTIPGFLLWTALVFSIVATGLTHLLGRPLARLNYEQQRFSGNFRFSLVRVRDNSEGIALYRGEAEEARGLRGRFADLFSNYMRIIRRTAWLGLLTGYQGYAADEFPIVICAPVWFAGRITFGTISQIAQVFGQVQLSLLWFMNNYGALAAYAAQVERLATFQRALAQARAIEDRISVARAGGHALTADALSLDRPDHAPLLHASELAIEPGRSAAIVGPSGTGKSTLFRAIAGIWPFGEGRISLPAGQAMFLPQRPYLPTGSLRRALCYPADPRDVPVATQEETFRAVGLATYLDRLDEDAPWDQRLSPGEQQRLAIARALLVRPAWLFLDEATSSLDEDSEEQLYGLLAARLPDTTLVSITHRESVARRHDQVVRLAPDGDASVLEAA